MTLHLRAPIRALSALVVILIALAGQLSIVDSLAAAALEPGPLQRPDAASALSLARATGEAVEVMNLRTETSETFANGDETFTLKEYLVPQRVRRGTDWVPVDTTLAFEVKSPPTVKPGATVTDLTFSGGGAQPLVTMRSGSSELSLFWKSALPTPTLSGNTATYANVYPDVDLEIKAEADSFTHALVVHNAAAGANPALRAITYKTATTGLTLLERDNETIQAIDSQEEPIFTSHGSFMWDVGGTGGGQFEEGEPGKIIQIPVKVEIGAITVTPEPTWLGNPNFVYPLRIDPPFAGGTDKWTHVNSRSPNTSYWGGVYRDSMRVGRQWGSSQTWRSFVRVNIAGVLRTQIISASFFVWLDHSGSCGPTPVQLWHTGFVSPSAPPTTWNNSAGHWLRFLQEVNADANEASCPKNDKLVEFGAPAVRDALQGMANGTFGLMTFGLKARNEGDQQQWKRFFPGAQAGRAAFLQVTYNRQPYTPTFPTAAQGYAISDCYTSCVSPAFVSRADPELRAFASDIDGGVLAVYFEVWNNGSAPLRTGYITGYLAGSASPARWRVTPPLPAEGWYKWRSASCDNHGWCSPWTGFFEFTTDTTAPPLATVTPVDPARYFEDTDPLRSSGGLGVPGQLRLGPNGATDVVDYTWWLDDGPHTTVTQLNPDKTVVITVRPTRDLVRVLRVISHDAAGRFSGEKTYRFRVTSPPAQTGQWLLNGNAQDGWGGHHGQVSPTGVQWVTGRVGTAAQFSGGSIATTVPVLATDRSFSVAAWVRLTDTADTRTIVSQDGTSAPMFSLQYRKAVDRFCLVVRKAALTETTTCAPTTPALNQWVHLAGVYEEAKSVLYLYVNGGPDNGGTVTQAAFVDDNWMALGPFTIGRSQNAGAAAQLWQGVVDEVHVYQRPLDPIEVQFLALQGS